MAYIYYTLHISGRIIEGVNVNLGTVEYQQFSDKTIPINTKLVITSKKAFYKEVSATTAVKILKLIGANY